MSRKYKINTPEGYTLYDSSLKEPWNASLVLAALDKQFRMMGVPSFTSAFGKKAHADLVSYENLRAQRAREIDELYTRPFDDVVVEEFISNLPGPTIEELDEPVEPAGGSAEGAPADSFSGEMAGASEAKQEPDSSAPMDTDAPEGSPLERYLVQRLRNLNVLGSHLRHILMIRAWRKAARQATTQWEALPLERHPCLI